MCVSPRVSLCCWECDTGTWQGVAAWQAPCVTLGTGQGAQPALTAAGRVAGDTSTASGHPGHGSGLLSPSQALHGAAAAQLPPALGVLHGDRGAPVHVLLRVLPGQLLSSLQLGHARRGQLRARAPLCHWQCPQEETAPAAAAAGPGEPCREGDEFCGGPQQDSAPLCPLGSAGVRVAG